MAKKITREPIYIKYSKYIEQARSGYTKGLITSEVMEILRYTEKRLGKSIPMNVGCGVCLIDLLNLFGNIENK